MKDYSYKKKGIITNKLCGRDILSKTHFQAIIYCSRFGTISIRKYINLSLRWH